MARSEKLQPGKLSHSNILVRVPNWVGDAVMSLPALHALREALPEARITLLARPWVRDVFPLDKLRCSVIDYDTQSTHRGMGGRLTIVGQLRQEGFDAALLFQNAFDAALVSWLARIPLRAGYARDGRRFLLTHAPLPPLRGETPPHESHYYLELLTRLGLITEYAPVQAIALRPASFIENGRSRLLAKVEELGFRPQGRALIGISPGASFGTAKRWPADRFASLAARLSADSSAVSVLFGSAQEAPLADEIAAASPGNIVSLAGKTRLCEFIELVAGCDAYVTNDTGTMHIAAALGVPTIAIFGPTNERETAPLGPRVQMVVGVADCRPCKLRHCPIDTRSKTFHQCMTSISPDAVLDRVHRILTHRQPAN